MSLFYFCFELLNKVDNYLTRGGRPATTTSHPSHNLPIFSLEPPKNLRPSIIMCQILEDKTLF